MIKSTKNLEPEAEWDLLSALPDLAFANMLTFLQAPQPASRGMAREALPLVCQKRALLDAVQTGYDEADQYGKWPHECRMGAVLMLRLTCWAVKQAIDAHVRLPPLAIVPLLMDWLQQHAGSSPPALCDLKAANRCNQMASFVLGSAHASLHQLRLPGVLDFVCQQHDITDAKRKELSHLFSPPSAHDGSGAQGACMRMVHFSHRSDYVGEDGGQGVDSRLTLSLPGHPHELVELACWAEMAAGYRSDHSCTSEVQVELHTTSALWAQRLGLVVSSGAAPGPLPLVRYDCAMEVIGVEPNVLPRLWTSLGFACQPMPGPAWPEKRKRRRSEKRKWRGGLAVPTSDVSEDNIRAPQGAPQGSNDDPMKWTVKEVAVVLLGSLGCAWKPDLHGHAKSHTDVTVQDIEDCEDDLERMHDNFADAMHERQSTWVMQFLSEWEAFAGRHIEPLMHSLVEREQAVVWELMARTVERFFGQLRLSRIAEALALLPKAYAETWLHQGSYHCAAEAPRQVLEGFRVLGAHSFCTDPQVSAESDGSVTYTTSCTRWLLRLPLGHGATEASRASGYLLFRYEYNRGDSWGCHSHWSLTMKVIGCELCSLFRAPSPPAASSESTDTGKAGDASLHVLLRSVKWDDCSQVATETLVRLGRLLGLSAADGTAASSHRPAPAKKQRVNEEASRTMEEHKRTTEGEGEVPSRPTIGGSTNSKKRGLEEDDAGGQHGDDTRSEESKGFAIQVASLLGFVGEMITWHAREQFPPTRWEEDDAIDEAALLTELLDALLPYQRDRYGKEVPIQ